MIRRRAKWGIALLVAFLSGCATGTNQRQTNRSADPAAGGGLVTSRLHRDPMQAHSLSRSVQSGAASSTRDARLSRFFPNMNARAATPVASQSTSMPPAPFGSTRSAPSPRPDAGPSSSAPEEPLSTLPVALTVGMWEPRATPPLRRPGMIDPNVIPTAAQVTELAPVKTPSLLPDDLSGDTANTPAAPASTTPENHAPPAQPGSPAPAPTARAAADAPADPPLVAATAPPVEPKVPTLEATPAADNPEPAAPAAASPAPRAPQYVEPMLVVSDPPQSIDALPPPPAPAAELTPDPQQSTTAPAPAAAPELPVPGEVPASAPVPPLPAPAGEPALDSKAEVPAAAPAPRPAETPKPASSPAQPPQVAQSAGSRPAPLPAPTLPSAPPNEAESQAPAPTVVAVPTSPQVPASPQSTPPVPSKQLPGLSPQAVCAQASPAPRSKLLITSLWPTWLGSGLTPGATNPAPAAAPAPGPAPRPALTSHWPTWSRSKAPSTPPAAPRPVVASHWPTWFRLRSAPAAQPAVAFAPPAPSPAPANADSKPAAVANARPRVVHGHGCSHHACQRDEEQTRWFGVNRSLETAGLFPPTYYETVIRRAGPGPAAAVATAWPSNASPAAPAPATPHVAVAAAPPSPAKPKRVWLVTRLWNRLHGNTDAPQPAAASTAPFSAPPAPTVASVSPAPAPAPAPNAAPASGNPVTGNLPQNGDSIERVSAERVNETPQR